MRRVSGWYGWMPVRESVFDFVVPTHLALRAGVHDQMERSCAGSAIVLLTLRRLPLWSADTASVMIAGRHTSGYRSPKATAGYWRVWPKVVEQSATMHG